MKSESTIDSDDHSDRTHKLHSKPSDQAITEHKADGKSAYEHLRLSIYSVFIRSTVVSGKPQRLTTGGDYRISGKTLA
jgi:hypothetical protein